MKKFATFTVLAGLAVGVFAQNAPANQIDLGLGLYDTDPTGAYKNFNTAAAGQDAKYSPSLNWNGKYTYTYKLDDANTLKFALADDGWYGFYDGKSGTAFASGQNAGKITPAAEWLGYGADITVAFPIYYFSPADLGGINELKYAYKETNYLPIASSAKSTGKYPLDSNSVISTTNLTAAYKYSFDKTTWVSGQVSTLIAFNPTPWVFGVLPKVSGGAYGAQLDVQLDDYNGYASNVNATTALKNSYYDLYLEPKLTYDLGFPGWVSGLKLYTQARIALATNNPAYIGSTAPGGVDQKFHDTYVQPGVNYSFAVPAVGSFAIDAGWRFNKIDNVGSVKDGTGTYTGLSSDTKKDVAPYSDLRIALSYTYKF